LEVARLARALRWTTAEVRAATYRDLHAMALVLAEEDVQRQQAQKRSRRR
jgi:hypothetical protein